MADISAQAVKQLRDKTGAGMMDCKKALKETDGDLTQAMDWLRKKGMASAANKGTRVAAEGLVDSYIHTGGRVGVLVEGVGVWRNDLTLDRTLNLIKKGRERGFKAVGAVYGRDDITGGIQYVRSGTHNITCYRLEKCERSQRTKEAYLGYRSLRCRRQRRSGSHLSTLSQGRRFA